MSESSSSTIVASSESSETTPEESCTFICSRGSLDGAYPALILSINAKRMGMAATIFFTFMGINVIRKGGMEKLQFIPQGTLGAIPGMASVATFMMKRQIDGAGIPTLGELMETAQLEGVKFVACKMTVDMMGLNAHDLIDGVEIQTAEQYLKHARNCKINMFT